ncbi:MAG: hypothetical protein K1X35_12500 [Caulobacteraceae bacterium]|nr:hypothetical protein [Caulobacteraceae bacterium]
MRRIMVLAATVLALAACQKSANKAAPPSSDSESVAPPVAAAPPAPTTLSADEAFRLAFGAPAPVQRSVTRQNDFEEVLSYGSGKLVPLAPDLVALVSTATNASDCHACSGALSVHYLKWDGTAWKRSGAWPELLYGNGFGAAPDWTVRQDLGRPNYLISQVGWTGQGYTCSSADVVYLGPDAPVVMGEGIPLHFDNEGVGEDPVVSIDGKLGRGPDGKLRVTFNGTRSGFTDYEIVGGKLHRVSENVIDSC